MFGDFLKWFASSPIASALRVALAFIINNMVADFVRVGNFDMTNWKSWVIGALAVSVPLILRWLNPEDKSFGAKG